MTAKILIPAVITAIVLTACSKDKFTTKPQITFKSVNGTEFSPGYLINFTFDATDKEGDIQDSMFVLRSGSACNELNGVTGFLMPLSTPKSDLKVEIDLTFIYKITNPPYIQLDGCTGKTDTTGFKFWIKDNAGNVSDTVQAPPIILLQ